MESCEQKKKDKNLVVLAYAWQYNLLTSLHEKSFPVL